jgi:type II secretory pathway component PulF
MGPAIGISILLVPTAIFVVAMGLRIAADSQPETSWAGGRRRSLFLASYVLVGIGLVLLAFSTIVTGLIGGASFVMFTLAVSQLVGAELKLIGKRRQAQQAEFLWMLSTTIRNESSLADEIETYAQGTWGRRHKRLLELADRLRNGTPLSEIAVPQGLLSRSASIEIQAGLQSGRLYESLRTAARRQTRELSEDVNSLQAQMALTYPATILAVITLVIGFLCYFIVPKLKKIFDDFGTELPDLTISVIRQADFSVNFGLLLSPVILLPVVALVVVGFADLYGWSVVWRWFVGGWFARPHTSDVLRALSRTVAAGVPLELGLEPFVSSSGPKSLQLRAAAVRAAISEGQSAWKQLERQGFLNSREVVLLESAQAVGNLPWTLEALADSLERRWSYRFQAVLELIGPMIILVLGVVVGIAAIAFFLPLVKMLNDLS